MPSVTAVALDSLLDRGTSGGGGRGNSHHHHPHRSNDWRQQGDRQGSGSGGAANGSLGMDVRRTPSLPYYFSPALYTTPEPARISGSSPTSVSPSPYVVNIKRRDFRPPPPQVSASNGVKEEEEVRGRVAGEVEQEEERFEEEGKESDLPVSGGLKETSLLERGGFDKEEAGDDDIDEFFKPRDSLSVMSNSDTEDGGVANRQVPWKGISAPNNSEFYDATEDFFSDNSASHISPLHTNTEADFRSLRLNLFEEIEKRKKAEECHAHMQEQWKNMALHFTHLGLPFPDIPDGSDIKHETDEISHVCQQIVVTRFVSEALERGLARAEVEESAERIIKSKNHEISRLHDRLRYYEAMNREMSQRNQENIELTRKKRQQRRRRQKWVWFCIGLSLTLGGSLLAYSFTPEASKGDQSPCDSNPNVESSSA